MWAASATVRSSHPADGEDSIGGSVGDCVNNIRVAWNLRHETKYFIAVARYLTRCENEIVAAVSSTGSWRITLSENANLRIWASRELPLSSALIFNSFESGRYFVARRNDADEYYMRLRKNTASYRLYGKYALTAMPMLHPDTSIYGAPYYPAHDWRHGPHPSKNLPKAVQDIAKTSALAIDAMTIANSKNGLIMPRALLNVDTALARAGVPHGSSDEFRRNKEALFDVIGSMDLPITKSGYVDHRSAFVYPSNYGVFSACYTSESLWPEDAAWSPFRSRPFDIPYLFRSMSYEEIARQSMEKLVALFGGRCVGDRVTVERGGGRGVIVPWREPIATDPRRFSTLYKFRGAPAGLMRSYLVRFEDGEVEPCFEHEFSGSKGSLYDATAEEFGELVFLFLLDVKNFWWRQVPEKREWLMGHILSYAAHFPMTRICNRWIDELLSLRKNYYYVRCGENDGCTIGEKIGGSGWVEEGDSPMGGFDADRPADDVVVDALMMSSRHSFVFGDRHRENDAYRMRVGNIVCMDEDLFIIVGIVRGSTVHYLQWNCSDPNPIVSFRGVCIHAHHVDGRYPIHVDEDVIPRLMEWKRQRPTGSLLEAITDVHSPLRRSKGGVDWTPNLWRALRLTGWRWSDGKFIRPGGRVDGGAPGSDYFHYVDDVLAYLNAGCAGSGGGDNHEEEEEDDDVEIVSVLGMRKEGHRVLVQAWVDESRVPREKKIMLLDGSISGQQERIDDLQKQLVDLQKKVGAIVRVFRTLES
jgi:hypothetical protein